jgi:hypothetical protein
VVHVHYKWVWLNIDLSLNESTINLAKKKKIRLKAVPDFIDKHSETYKDINLAKN